MPSSYDESSKALGRNRLPYRRKLQMRRSPTQCYEWSGYIEVASPVRGPHHSSGFTSFEARAARVFFCPASWDAVWIRSEFMFMP